MISGEIQGMPELRFTANGHAHLTMDVLVQIGKKSHTFRVVAWDAIAEAIANDDKYFKLGARISVEGYHHTHEWVNHRTGEKHSEPQYVVKEVINDGA